MACRIGELVLDCRDPELLARSAPPRPPAIPTDAAVVVDGGSEPADIRAVR